MSKICGAECQVVELCQGHITQAEEWLGMSEALAEKAQQQLKEYDQGPVTQHGVFDLAAYREKKKTGQARAVYEKRVETCEDIRSKDQAQVVKSKVELAGIQGACNGYSKLRAKFSRRFGRVSCGSACDTSEYIIQASQPDTRL